ncbi:MAG TPA: NB-ARC domain-containing protein [Armatimonadaceae bacterium]|nr:NB-ARC domain-containing protein [Armatimonadaceae bacterium]
MWYVRLLGGLVAEREGYEPVRRFRTQKHGLLLAYLALYPRRAHTREELVELFWPDSDPEAARASLRSALAALRRHLPTDAPSGGGDAGMPTPEIFLKTNREAVQLDPEVVTADVTRFEKLLERASDAGLTRAQRDVLLRRAAGLYAGPLLPGVYEDWALTERERLEAVWEELKERLPGLAENAAPDGAVAGSAARDPATPTRPTSTPVPLPANAPTLPAPVVLAAPAPPRGPVVALPFPANRFWGRDEERQRIAEWTAETDARLLTITGIGGIGKTRLALEAARESAAKKRFDITCFVSLSAALDVERMSEQIVATLGSALRRENVPARASATDPVDDLLEMVRSLEGRTLLVLDNVEQLVDAGGGDVIQALLSEAPVLRILATSRQRLLVDGERDMPLQGLDEEADVGLFVDRARAVRPDLALNDRSRDAVREICERIDGIPLAIELCAAWSHLMTPTQMREKMDGRFDLLTSSRRKDDASRHRSLRAALEWGFDLPASLRKFFAGLSVFRGGWTLEAAEEVLDAPDALERLAHLHDRSLIAIEEGEEDDEGMPSVRYRFLESVREFAAEKMTPQESSLLRGRHLRHYADFVGQAQTALRAGESRLWFERIEREDENIRAALDYGTGEGGPNEIALSLQMLRHIGPYWWVRGGQRAGGSARWALRAYERRAVASGPALADILLTAARLLPAEAAGKALEEAYAMHLALGNRERLATIRREQSMLAYEEGRFEQAVAYMREVGEIRYSLGDRDGLGIALAETASYYTLREDFGTARELLLESIEKGDPRAVGGIAKVKLALATIARVHGGDPGEAERLCREAVGVFRARGETWNYADALKGLGFALLDQDRFGEAAPLLDESIDLFLKLGDEGQVRDIESYRAAREGSKIAARMS